MYSSQPLFASTISVGNMGVRVAVRCASEGMPHGFFFLTIMFKLTTKRKYMVRFLYGIHIDTWPRRKRWGKIKNAISYCRNNHEWDEYWEFIKSTLSEGKPGR